MIENPYRPPRTPPLTLKQSRARTGVIVAGVALAVTAPVVAALPWVVGWIRVPVRELVAQGVFDAVMAPIDLRLAVVRLVAGLIALPGLVSIGCGSKRLGERAWCLGSAVGWPALAASEIAYRLVSDGRIPFGGVFHNLDVLAGISALAVITRERGRIDFVRALFVAVVAIHVVISLSGAELPFDARAALGVLALVASMVLGAAVAWYGVDMIGAGPSQAFGQVAENEESR